MSGANGASVCLETPSACFWDGSFGDLLRDKNSDLSSDDAGENREEEGVLKHFDSIMQCLRRRRSVQSARGEKRLILTKNLKRFQGVQEQTRQGLGKDTDGALVLLSPT